MKKQFTAQAKAQIALKALAETDTLSAIASSSGAHTTQVGLWKKAAKENLHLLFDKTNSEAKKIKALKAQVDELHRLVGQRDEELAWLQKKISL